MLIKHLDMGQGNTTGLTTIVADELDADWSQMRSAFAPANPLLYNNLLYGPIQGTGGSTAIANSWDQLRRAGAAARVMLIAAAADSWGVPEKEITISKGIITHATIHSYGDVVHSFVERDEYDGVHWPGYRAQEHSGITATGGEKVK